MAETWRMVPTSRRTSKRDRVDIITEDGRYVALYVWEPDARRILGALAHEQAEREG